MQLSFVSEQCYDTGEHANQTVHITTRNLAKYYTNHFIHAVK